MLAFIVDARDSREASKGHDIFYILPASSKNNLYVVLYLLDVISEIILAFLFVGCMVKSVEKSFQCGVVFLPSFKLGEHLALLATLCRSIAPIKVLDILSNLLQLIIYLAFACLTLLIEYVLDTVAYVVLGIIIRGIHTVMTGFCWCLGRGVRALWLAARIRTESALAECGFGAPGG